MPEQAIYERQNLIGDLEIPEVATVVGCGGTGFWTAVFLAMSGVEELILVDSDIVEVSNLNRLLLEESAVGIKKAEALKGLILGIRKRIRIEIQDMRIEKPLDCQILRGDIFCCTDNLKSQQTVCAFCKKNNLRYQRIGYDGTILNVSKTFPLSFEEPTGRDGYTVTPSWVIPAVFAAAAGVASRTYKELCLMDDIGKIHTQHSSYVCQKILDDARDAEREHIEENIHEYIPDSYGLCEDCNRIDPEGSDYGYCPDCKEHYSDDDIEDIKEKAKDEEYDRIIEQIETGEITDPKLKEAFKVWQRREGGK
ncbi:MAG: ThiF family adenylyltransferase [Candidatus Omnitrophota bacterium]|nr:ThiF family adenylyltransferase [Candidatus Omnitrophota bacterium]